MGRLILKSLSLLAAVAATCAYIYSLNPLTGGNQHDYMAAMIDKHRRLDSLPSPKLIFVGASNLAFGLNCRIIEDSLKMPVVNMGLHGGLGLSFILKEGRSNIQAGDIVILSIEHYVGVKGDPQLIKRTIDLYPPAAEYAQADGLTKPIAAMFDPLSISAYVKRIQTNSLEGVRRVEVAAPKWGYRRELFSSYGDVVAELNLPMPKEIKVSKFGHNDYHDGIDELNAYADYVRSRDALVYFIYPDYRESAYQINKDGINHLAELFQRNLKIEIINTPEDFVFPDSLFLDTVYHMTKEGREQRTLALVRILKEKVFNRKGSW
jgi:hypothetical protein